MKVNPPDPSVGFTGTQMRKTPAAISYTLLPETESTMLMSSSFRADLPHRAPLRARGASMPAESVQMQPIGWARTPFVERMSTPRQPHAAKGARGFIELAPNRHFEHALVDLERWDHIWVIFWFHLNEHWRPKVLPPRSSRRRGVFATRLP